jgi:hypothetical protein
MSQIFKMCAFISLIYFKTIVMDTFISFEKWRGSQLHRNNHNEKTHQTTTTVSTSQNTCVHLKFQHVNSDYWNRPFQDPNKEDFPHDDSTNNKRKRSRLRKI